MTELGRLPPHVRTVRFFEERPWLGDSLFKVAPLTLMALLIWGLSASHYGFIGNAVDPQVMLLLELMAIVPLAISRIQPGVAAGIIATAALLQMLTLSGPGVSALSVPLVVYTCAKYGSRRVSRSYLTIALLGAVLLAICVGYQQMVASIYPADAPTAMVNLLLIGGFAAAVVLVFWLFGDLAGRKRAQLEAVEEKNRLLERERDQEARLAADAERMRIAREMHDVISHSMSVMIAQAGNGREALDLIGVHTPDVVLMDIRMPVMDGLEATAQITADQNPAHTKVIVLTTFDTDEYALQALQSGASGFLLKDVQPEVLLDSIRTVVTGGAVVAPTTTRRLLDSTLLGEGRRRTPTTARQKRLQLLTKRERQMLEEMATGDSNTEIAARLFLSEATVKTHVGQVLAKLAVRDRVQAVVFAYEAGLVGD